MQEVGASSNMRHTRKLSALGSGRSRRYRLEYQCRREPVGRAGLALGRASGAERRASRCFKCRVVSCLRSFPGLLAELMCSA